MAGHQNVPACLALELHGRVLSDAPIGGVVARLEGANGVPAQTEMKNLRVDWRHLGRILLMSALVGSLLVTTAVGEALVLHQHGFRGTHLHLLGWGDLRSHAAWSSRFGHASNPRSSHRSVSQHVRIVAVISIGSVFVPTAEGEYTVPKHQSTSPLCTALLNPPTEKPLVRDSQIAIFSVPLDQSASAILLLRNHALLI